MALTGPSPPGRSRSPDFFRTNSLSLVCFALFAIFVVGLLFTGFREHNANQKTHKQPELTLGEYASSGAFWEALTVNWDSGRLASTDSPPGV
jgi:hypothetical protein